MNIPKNICKALNILNSNGFKAGVVGGCIRDSIMGNKPHDFDITTNATPDEIKRLFKDFKIIDTGGEKHGTVVVLVNNETVEITTFRIDGIYSDGRRPDEVTFTDVLEEDLLRRDFTMNAIFYDGNRVIDPFNGKNDIKDRIIRAVGNPNIRFKEDALRILRALRFASKYGFKIETETKKAMFTNKKLLSFISTERIAVEFVKILEGKYVVDILEEYVEIILEFIPELKPLIDFDQKNKWHVYDIWKHTLKSMNAIDNKLRKDKKLMYRLTILFHDIGKPNCMTETEGIRHFYGHPIESEKITRDIFSRLKLTNAEGITSNFLKDILILIKNHDIELSPKKTAIVQVIKEKLDGNIDLFKDLIYIKTLDNFGQNLVLTRDRTKLLFKIEHIFDELKEKNVLYVKISDLDISGNDLIFLGLKGTEIGKMLNSLLDDVSMWNIENKKVTLIKSVKKRLEKKKD